MVKENRFTDNGDGTVTDNLNKLIWLKNANAFGVRTWEQALSDANTLASGTAGLTDGSKAGDWRLPNVKELQGLVDFYINPALSGKRQGVNGDAFVSVRLCGGYWSMATTDKDDISYAWYVCLGSGIACTDGKASVYYVWPVRGGIGSTSSLPGSPKL